MPTGTPQGDQTPTPKVVTTVDELKEDAPEPNSKASKKYRVKYPNTNFIVEGMPVVTKDGVALTAEQAKKVIEMAKLCNVSVVEVND